VKVGIAKIFKTLRLPARQGLFFARSEFSYDDYSLYDRRDLDRPKVNWLLADLSGQLSLGDSLDRYNLFPRFFFA